MDKKPKLLLKDDLVRGRCLNLNLILFQRADEIFSLFLERAVGDQWRPMVATVLIGRERVAIFKAKEVDLLIFVVGLDVQIQQALKFASGGGFHLQDSVGVAALGDLGDDGDLARDIGRRDDVDFDVAAVFVVGAWLFGRLGLREGIPDEQSSAGQ